MIKDERIEIDFPPYIWDQYKLALHLGIYDPQVIIDMRGQIDPVSVVLDETYLDRFLRCVYHLSEILRETEKLKSREKESDGENPDQ